MSCRIFAAMNPATGSIINHILHIYISIHNHCPLSIASKQYILPRVASMMVDMLLWLYQPHSCLVDFPPTIHFLLLLFKTFFFIFHILDISKAPLPPSFRSHFTELFVSEPTTLEDLRLVADACLQGGMSSPHFTQTTIVYPHYCFVVYDYVPPLMAS